MLQVNVAGGANSGRKKPLAEPHQDWLCRHGHFNRGYATRCLHGGCNVSRELIPVGMWDSFNENGTFEEAGGLIYGYRDRQSMLRDRQASHK